MQGVRLILIATIAASFSTMPLVISAQENVEFYTTQFRDLAVRVDVVLSGARNATSAYSKLSISEDSLDLTRRVHRLQEGAARTNLEVLKQSGRPNRTLLLVIQGCSAMDFTLIAVSGYLDSGDAIFLRFAESGKGLTQLALERI